MPVSPKAKQTVKDAAMWIAVIVGGVGLVTTAARAIGNVDARYVTRALYENNRTVDSLQRLREFSTLGAKLDSIKVCVKHREDCK